MTLLLLLKPVYPPDAIGTGAEVFSGDAASAGVVIMPSSGAGTEVFGGVGDTVRILVAVGTAVEFFAGVGVGIRPPFPGHIPQFAAMLVSEQSGVISMVGQAAATATDMSPRTFGDVLVQAVVDALADLFEQVEVTPDTDDAVMAGTVEVIESTAIATASIVQDTSGTVSVDRGMTATVILEE